MRRSSRRPEVEVADAVHADIDQRRLEQELASDAVAAGVREERRVELAEEIEVAGSHGSDRTDLRRSGGVEDRRKSGEATLDLFDIDDVGLVDAGLGPSGGHIVDLDGQSRPGLGVEGGETGEQCRVLEGTQQFDAGDGLLEFTVRSARRCPSSLRSCSAVC